MLQRTVSAGFIAPCLPTKTDKLPSGGQWLHEIKHDGFRIIARKTGAQLKAVMLAAHDLPPEKCSVLLEMVAGELRTDLAVAVRAALAAIREPRGLNWSRRPYN